MACVAENGPLKFEKSTKNLIVELSNYDQFEAENWRDEVVNHLKNVQLILNKDQLNYVKYGQSFIESGGLQLPKVREKSLRKFIEKAQVMKLLSGVTISIDNNALGKSRFDYSVAISEAGYLNGKFQMSVLKNEAAKPSQFTKVLNNVRDSWWQFPIKKEMRPFFYHRIPFGGDYKNLCLIGKFISVDLMTGGASEHPLNDPTAQLYGILSEWYIIDRTSEKIVAHQEYKEAPATSS